MKLVTFGAIAIVLMSACGSDHGSGFVATGDDGGGDDGSADHTSFA
jgi:hypothetical protein